MSASTVILRQWKDSDLEPFAEMNADPRVMRYFLKSDTREEAVALFARARDGIDKNGWGVWAVEADGAFAGFTGLIGREPPALSTHFTPCIEIAWRLRPEFWGKSIAYRAACQAEAFAFSTLKLSELVSFTTETNLTSRRLMERLGFRRNPADDFDHPLVPAGHPLLRHVLYRKQAGQGVISPLPPTFQPVF